MVAERHQQGHEGGGAHARGDVLDAHGEHEDRVALAGERQPHVREGSHGLQDAERHQRAVEAEAHHEHAAQDHAHDRGREAHHLVDRADFGEREAGAAQQECRGERARERVAQLVQDDEREEPERARAREELAERIHHRGAQRARRGMRQIRLAAPDRADDADAHQRGHREVRAVPAEGGNPSRPRDQHQREGARDQHRDAIAHDTHGAREPALGRRRHVDLVGVDHDVLRRGGECNEERQRAERREVGTRR